MGSCLFSRLDFGFGYFILFSYGLVVGGCNHHLLDGFCII